MILYVFFVLTVGGGQWASASDYKIEKVTQNVYRFVADKHRSVFLVTEIETDFFAATGPEPFSRICTAKYLHKCAEKRNQAVKSFIVDSHVIAGIGNIYANDSLF